MARRSRKRGRSKEGVKSPLPTDIQKCANEIQRTRDAIEADINAVSNAEAKLEGARATARTNQLNYQQLVGRMKELMAETPIPVD